MRSMLIAVVAVLILSTVALAEIPQMMSYQGRATDNSGNPVANSTYSMRFRIFDAPTGGSLVWDSGDVSVATNAGVFGVILGESPQPAVGLDFDEDYWLLVTFDGEDQLPRKRLGSVGYAYMASGLVPGTEVAGSSVAYAIKGTYTECSYAFDGLVGETYSTEGGSGVRGVASATIGTNHGVRGKTLSPWGTGVYGSASATTGSAWGVYGWSSSTSGRGVHGRAGASSGETYGVYGTTSSSMGTGVHGEHAATDGTHAGVSGTTSSESDSAVGVCGTVESTSPGAYSTGVRGVNNGTGLWGIGVYGSHDGEGYGVYGTTPSGRGVYGRAWGSIGTNYGVFGGTNSPSGYGGYFQGDVYVAGTLSKSSGSFLIDHPLDPENKLLRHNFVESPENLLIYRGTVRLDAQGEAVVSMPEYFEVLAKEHEATVCVTPVGRPFLAGHEWDAERGAFTAYGDPGREVTWIVCADRDDPVIRELRRPVEEDKGPGNKYCDRGKLLHPTAYGYPESMGRDYELHEGDRQRIEEERGRMEEERARMDEERARVESERARATEEVALLRR